MTTPNEGVLDVLPERDVWGNYILSAFGWIFKSSSKPGKWFLDGKDLPDKLKFENCHYRYFCSPQDAYAYYRKWKKQEAQPDLGKVAYYACRKSIGEVFLVSGVKLPEWELLPGYVQRAWQITAEAVNERGKHHA